MFDIAASEVLVVVIVAILVIGPKDMPAALRAAGRWIGKIRRVSGHFRSGLDTMIREAEMEDMERKWREQNRAIMAAHPDVMTAEDSGIVPDDGAAGASTASSADDKPHSESAEDSMGVSAESRAQAEMRAGNDPQNHVQRPQTDMDASDKAAR
ncbi:twin-arginine translocase subunit TatB [Altererythrobacter sp. SALINAS58]|uniref:Sec-independent protein translocase protein TatB n=1 Tax=Alteripontixanthobacter muriae TaxID=2705546 RepID=UPI001577479D|nr:Sec-independent protein translocase protein TatB [Alteripontixanthobacter muriae]NTZ42229.1 twin-arginine translocase subunit TatB [Alteripontixanthobacter muriae]